ncbi:conjugative transposon protein TraM [Chitinophaga alhagiae]|uniref:conjugative transposon protein TraM n=1 Tax=Chitinophaga alhagiae TaxID=2203219 RepID=UPI000E5C0A7E|nr:conjugative transposon protein TraM [Chitinophaga alhagiae]
MTSISLSKLDIKKYLRLLPFAAFVLTLTFYYLFTFLAGTANKGEPSSKSAFNTELPSPKLDDRYKNKLDIYMEARQDSIRRLKEAKRDSVLFPVEAATTVSTVGQPGDISPAELRGSTVEDRNVKRSNKAMAMLREALSRQEDLPEPTPEPRLQTYSRQPAGTTELSRMEEIMNAAATSPTDDAELRMLDGMLDKIREIKQPGSTTLNKSQGQDTTPALFASSVAPASVVPDENVEGNGFYGLAEETSADQTPGSGTISAVVHADQRVKTGSIVRLRLTQDMYVNNARVPANASVYGVATVAKERVQLDIKHAVYANTVLPIKLSVFDIDGIPGISTPGADAHDASRDGLNQVVQNLELYSMDPSIGAQAAASGIQAAKGLISKKTKTPYAMLKANHKVMLVNGRF